MRFLIFLITFCFWKPAWSAFEAQANVLPSFAIAGRPDMVLSSHSTLMFGAGFFHMGLYCGYESLSQSVIDTSLGGAIRFGEDHYVEIQAGSFERNFSQNSQRLSGRGVSANLIYGVQLSKNFGLAAFLSAKKISTGDLDKRLIVDLLPFFTARAEF